jgi:short-subunit dehydrogenase involved in D-alanine esterification of teichoic acids
MPSKSLITSGSQRQTKITQQNQYSSGTEMKLTGNTIFITGGGSGIGRGLAEALHKLGNQIIISGRRMSHLDATTRANSGMASFELNINDPASIAAVTKELIAQFPTLNVLINIGPFCANAREDNPIRGIAM